MSMIGSIVNKMFARSGRDGANSASMTGSLGGKPRRDASLGPIMQPPPQSSESFDVEAMLTRMAAECKGEKLDWRRSTVDLLKLLGLDASLAGRRSLAAELGYRGDPDDTAAMNMWLHRQVLEHLVANNGKVPGTLWNVV